MMREVVPAGAADLKFLHHSRQARSRTAFVALMVPETANRQMA
jgi:hypothetical protein